MKTTRPLATGMAIVALLAAATALLGVRYVTPGTWDQRADEAQRALSALYWSPQHKMFSNQTPCPHDLCNEKFHYWWQAHGVDVLVDGLIRTGDSVYTERLAEVLAGLQLRNGGHLFNEFYDDMEWMALAYLRAYDATKDEAYRQVAQTLWTDIKTGWNEHQGGGIAWKKTQVDYKNTPANAPAAILGARLYNRFGNPDDLAWAIRIYEWQMRNLVDPETGFVWDGKNRQGDGRIDKDWEFTYCQGVVIGAGIELYRATGQEAYLNDAVRTARAARAGLTNPVTGALYAEGTSDREGDIGLFKGILARYLGELLREVPDQPDALALLTGSAGRLWQEGKAPDQALFSLSWVHRPEGEVSLSVNLSGVMLVEQMAVLEKAGLLK